MFFTVLEIQETNDGARACTPTIYYDVDPVKALSSAKAKYFTICTAASVSTIPYHAAFILSDEGQIVKGEIFDRRSKG